MANSVKTTDIAVIGAGPGGYVAAIRAAQRGHEVVLVDDSYGGTCLNRGCIPSKALLTATDDVENIGHSEHRGIYADPYVEMSELLDWKDDVVEQLTDGVEQLCAAAGVQFVAGRASFETPHEISIDPVDETTDGPDTIEFDHAILATGSRPIELPDLSFETPRILDAAGVLSLEDIPNRLVVVGAGYIGMELSMVYAKLGTDVVVLEALDEVFPGYDRDIVEPVKQRAQELGIEFYTNHAAEAAEVVDDRLVVTASADGTQPEFTCDYALVAVGRRPVTDTVSLANANIEVGEDGFVPTDEYCRTPQEHIYAIGDVAGEPLLAHKASAEAKTAVADIEGDATPLNRDTIPAAVFTTPEIVTVGHDKSTATEEGHDVIVGKCPFAANGRALTHDASEGFVRVIADAETGRILGGQAVGPEVSELSGELSLAVSAGLQLEQLTGAVHVHPTLSEAIVEAAENALGEAIHTTNN